MRKTDERIAIEELMAREWRRAPDWPSAKVSEAAIAPVDASDDAVPAMRAARLPLARVVLVTCASAKRVRQAHCPR
ncbi:hypothetical protein GLS40_09745 [Pseudooceanicola sp. 216_PA32_1]|uniref:Uncharacterized protein n=1 Tax=Pseudooceanicola pacificus TaxID=2676438 RepID=A0A844W3D2_9RHOB|nr:hypothetical protein [Pseudooceanicola pacificus]MWB78307.1 hypothetical protein [Pseudooceanicola pacificus]